MIINADDFGARSSVNKAIIDLLKDRRISSTTIMANMPGFAEAVCLAHENKLTEKVGVHLVLTEGVPLTNGMRQIEYLFNKDVTPRKFLVKKLFFLSKTEKTLIFKEFSKQIEKVKQEGIQINHLDTHQHMHDMWGIMQIMMELLKTYNIPYMRILNNLERTGNYKYMYRSTVNNYLKVKKVNYSDFFGSRIDFLSATKRDADFAKKNRIEIMVHPDFNSNGQIVDICSKKEYDFDFLDRQSIVNTTSTKVF